MDSRLRGNDGVGAFRHFARSSSAMKNTAPQWGFFCCLKPGKACWGDGNKVGWISVFP
jgi:hypothetical protein